MSVFSSVCTEQFFHADRLLKWQELMSDCVGKAPDYVKRLETVSLEPLNNHPFSGRLEYGALGELHLCRMVCSPHRLSRNLSQALTSSDTPYFLTLQMGGVSHFEQCGNSFTLTPGDALLMDAGHPFNTTSMKGCESLIVLCQGLSTPRCGESGLHLNKRNGLGRMLYNIITDAYTQYALLNDTTAHVLGLSIISLLNNALDNRQRETKLEHDTQYFKKNRIQAFIEHNLGNRDLTIERIAEVAQCSVRTLHRVFETESGHSLSEYIWQRRLSRCAEDLRNPKRGVHSITDIAYGWGFNSSSHFSKAFKTVYGMSPRLFRESACLSMRH